MEKIILSNIIEQLNKMRKDIRECTACSLCKDCTKPVAFAGNLASRILFVGRDPGKDEDRYGYPFIGECGKLLTEVCLLCGFDIWEETIISNVIKCKPLDNKAPAINYYQFCYEQWLKKEIDLIKPKIIVLLGKQALNIVLPGIKLNNGESFIIEDINYYHLYHPSFWVRNGRMTYSKRMRKSMTLVIG